MITKSWPACLFVGIHSSDVISTFGKHYSQSHQLFDVCHFDLMTKVLIILYIVSLECMY